MVPGGWRRAGCLACAALLIVAWQDGAESRVDAPPALLGSLAVEPSGDGGAQLRLGLDAPVVVAERALDDPPRLELTLEPVRLAPGLARSAVHGAGGPVLAHELAEEAGAVRIVLSLARPLRIASAVEAAGALRLSLAPGAPPPPEPRPLPAGAGVLTVAIDPGHGGHDPGAMVEGIVEKDLVLAFSRRLEARIAATPGLAAVLTRRGDRFLPLGARIRAAVDGGADVFLSIHADTVAEGNASGISVYTMSPVGLALANEALVAATPLDQVLSGADLSGAGDDVSRVLVDLAQRRSSAAAEDLAATLLATLEPEVELLRTRPHREANLRVLRAPDMPSLLLELGFLSSEEDRRRLTDRRWQETVASLIAEALADWHAGMPAR